jgi:large subunit ribosomal protein L41e
LPVTRRECLEDHASFRDFSCRKMRAKWRKKRMRRLKRKRRKMRARSK